MHSYTPLAVKGIKMPNAIWLRMWKAVVEAQVALSNEEAKWPAGTLKGCHL